MERKETSGIRIENAPDGEKPVCPYCKQSLDMIWIMKKGTWILEQKQIIMCPNCRSLLGFGVFTR